MNKNSNTYILVYATILVVVVASVLSFVATYLQPQQQANLLTEKMEAIISSVGVSTDVPSHMGKDIFIKKEFNEYIKQTYFVNSEGGLTKSSAKTVLASLDKLELIFEEKSNLPLFEAQISDGTILYIIPVIGKGLWGPIWGYISLNQDCNTIYGVKIDHKQETPGLGAEISTEAFGDQFIGKKLFDKGAFVSIQLLKGVGTSAGNPFAVDAITGGTLTTNGVEAMLLSCLGDYVPFFKTKHEKPRDEIESIPVPIH